MSDYKTTLNLPKTDFPMKANLAAREPAQLEKWQQMDLYHAVLDSRSNAQRYICHDGPPYANGHLHLGHTLNKILKDAFVKLNLLNGKATPYVPGWDCHGLPIELKVEQKVGKAGVKISASEFRQACRDYARGQIDIQRGEFKRLGVFADWEHPYITMDYTYEANIVRGFAKIIANGHLERGEKPVHWCVECGSALAEAEVEYANKQSSSIDVAFAALDTEKVQAAFGISALPSDVYAVIWTTTPWTLPANQAVSVHPELSYQLVHVPSQGRTYIIAEDLLTSVLARWKIAEHEILGSCQGSALEHLQLQHPFLDKQVPIILGDHVTVENGTGLVHTAPAHGLEDYSVCKQYDIEIINPVASNGCFKDDTPHVAGIHVFKADVRVLELLQAQQTLVHAEKLEHSYPHCWRHKKPLIFRSTPQWFISMDKQRLREKALAALDDVHFEPATGRERLSSMIRTRPDWCISRQRAWGTPLTLLVHKNTGAVHPDMVALIEGPIAAAIEKSGINAWFELSVAELLADEHEDYEKITDVMDVWLDSGLSHYCVLEQRKELHAPADLYLEGSDQHRGWFQSSLLTSVAMHGRAPYKTILTHGFTVDEHGHKMSKSLGNTMAPEKIINKLGADVVRLWVASTDYRYDMTVSEEFFKRTSDVYRRIRNTLRYLLANLDGFDPDSHVVAYDDLLSGDLYILAACARLQTKVQAAYADYALHQVVNLVHHFCSIDLGSFYLDVIKDRQYTMQTDAKARRSAQTVMWHIAESMTRMIAPILSFTAEEVWSYLPGTDNNSVFYATWYEQLRDVADEHWEFWQTLLAVRDAVNLQIEHARNDGVLRSGLAADVTLYANEDLAKLLNTLGDELHFVLISATATVLPLTEKPSAVTDSAVEGLAVVINASSNEKCVRCWHHVASVGENSEHPDLCTRCVTNVAGSGEERHYV